jgi:hypothetical protein
MAPEQLRGAKDIDGRADQYALAVLLYELLSGDIPAGRMRSLHLVNPDVPRAMSSAIDRALDAQREDRFLSLAQFVEAMQRGGAVINLVRMRWLAPVVAGVLLVGIGVAFWPQMSNWIPNPAKAREQRDAAIQAQGVIETQLKRLESLERDQESKLREASSKVDRTESAMRSARNDADRNEAATQLAAARAQLALETEVRDESARLAFRSDALAKVRGELAVGVAALRDAQPERATQVLGAAQTSVDALTKLPGLIRESILARREHELTTADLERLGRDEKRDVSTALSAARTQGDQARAAVSAGKAEEAIALYRAGTAQAAQALNALVDSLVLNYGKLAEQAVQADKLEIAQAALDRAKKVKALRRGGSS